jgi:hypothetical protein
MADDLGAVSDLQLLERMRARANDGWSLGVWLLVPGATIPAGALYGESAALAALLVSIGVCVVLLRMRQGLPTIRDAALAEREYRRRFRLYELSDFEAEALASLEKPGAPDTVLLFSGMGLPHGVHHFVRIDLGDQPKLQIRRAPMPQDWVQADDPASALFRYDAPLSDENVSRVKRVLATVTAELLAPPNRFVIDGYPCSAAVFRRGAAPLWTNLNMAGLPPELYQHPSARLLRLFIELEADAESSSVR